MTSDKIKDGEVKAEDLDPGIKLGGGFSLQVTERSKSFQVPDPGFAANTVSIQCHSDEVITGGGYASNKTPDKMEKQDNG